MLYIDCCCDEWFVSERISSFTPSKILYLLSRFLNYSRKDIMEHMTHYLLGMKQQGTSHSHGTEWECNKLQVTDNCWFLRDKAYWSSLTYFQLSVYHCNSCWYWSRISYKTFHWQSRAKEKKKVRQGWNVNNCAHTHTHVYVYEDGGLRPLNNRIRNEDKESPIWNPELN